MKNNSASSATRTAIAVSLCIAAASALNAAVDTQAVVSIFSTTKAGDGALGTGFFISPNGRLLTCYHVILNASSLEVIFNKQALSQVVVESIDPGHDLAVLAVKGLRRPVPFLRISAYTPASFASAALETFGHPSVLRNQHLAARPTSDTFLQSQDFRDPANSHRLFALRNVDLIGIDLTIFNGLSGAPLIFKDAVVGLISGSFQQGGSIAWAIPAKYVDGLQPVGRPASDIRNWPPLTLMASPFRGLRKQAQLGLNLVLALEHYAVAVDALDALVQSTFSDREFLRFLRDLQGSIIREIDRRGASAKIYMSDELSRELRARGHSAKSTDRMIDRLDEFFGGTVECVGAIADAEEKLGRASNEYFERLPRTTATEELKQVTHRRLGAIADALHSINRKLSDANQAGLHRILAAILDENFLTLTVENMRGIQDVVESVFEASARAYGQ